MNELRWILLGIGILVIAAIYFWESWKQKRELRSRIDSYPAPPGDYPDIHISPKKEKHREKELDLSSAAAAFNSYLRKLRDDKLPDTTADVALQDAGGNGQTGVVEKRDGEEGGVHTAAPGDEKIIVIYIVAGAASALDGNALQTALEDAGLEYGDMKIFHYRGEGDEFKQRTLFSVANIHEPGTFDIDNMATMNTDGLAMFMCLPAPVGGDIAFEIMLDCARRLADQLGAELRNEKHEVLDIDGINQLRQLASQY